MIDVLKPLPVEEAMALNNEWQPLWERLKVLTSKAETETAKKAKNMGIVLTEETKEKQRTTFGIIVAVGSDADAAFKPGMVVEFGRYTGYRPVTGSKPLDGELEYQVIDDRDCTQILSTWEDYKRKFKDTLKEAV